MIGFFFVEKKFARRIFAKRNSSRTSRNTLYNLAAVYLYGIYLPTTRNRQQAKPGQSLRPGQAEQESCKKGLRNSRTEVPTPEAGALLSGLITVPTSTRGICVRAYTLRGEKEGEREKKSVRGRRGEGSETRGGREREV